MERGREYTKHMFIVVHFDKALLYMVSAFCN